MIKFFRRIRYDLMEKNLPAGQAGKTGKPTWPVGRYLKYAVGEIILVVLGILIAVQINDWNNNRLEKKSDYQLIGALITDLKSKDAVLLGDLEYGKSLIKRTDGIVDNWSKNRNIDTLNLKLSIINLGDDRAFFNDKSPVFEAITNSNLWKRLPDSLLNQIDDIYRGHFTAVKSAFDKLNEYNTHCKLNFLIPNGLTDSNLNTMEVHTIIDKNKVEYISYMEVYRDGIGRLNNRLENFYEGNNKLIKNLIAYRSEMKE